MVESRERIVELLSKHGLDKNIAKITVFLSGVQEVTSRDINITADLRQPQVSLIMKELRELGWVQERELRRNKNGRPKKGYKLVVELKEIVSNLIQKRRDGLSKLEEEFSRVGKACRIRLDLRENVLGSCVESIKVHS